MERGRVVDQGTHEVLLSGGGIYADLHRLQFKENAPIGGHNPLDPANGGTTIGAPLTDAAPKPGLFTRFAQPWFGR